MCEEREHQRAPSNLGWEVNQVQPRFPSNLSTFSDSLQVLRLNHWLSTKLHWSGYSFGWVTLRILSSFKSFASHFPTGNSSDLRYPVGNHHISFASQQDSSHLVCDPISPSTGHWFNHQFPVDCHVGHWTSVPTSVCSFTSRAVAISARLFALFAC